MKKNINYSFFLFFGQANWVGSTQVKFSSVYFLILFLPLLLSSSPLHTVLLLIFSSFHSAILPFFISLLSLAYPLLFPPKRLRLCLCGSVSLTRSHQILCLFLKTVQFCVFRSSDSFGGHILVFVLGFALTVRCAFLSLFFFFKFQIMGSYFKPWWERKMAAFLMNLGLTWRIWLETEDLIECFVWFLWISLAWFPFL